MAALERDRLGGDRNDPPRVRDIALGVPLPEAPNLYSLDSETMTMKNKRELTKTTPYKDTNRLADASDGSVSDAMAVAREQMIAEAAYFRAEQRGFAPGHELGDWLDAEVDVVRQLSTAPPTSTGGS